MNTKDFTNASMWLQTELRGHKGEWTYAFQCRMMETPLLVPHEGQGMKQMRKPPDLFMIKPLSLEHILRLLIQQRACEMYTFIGSQLKTHRTWGEIAEPCWAACLFSVHSITQIRPGKAPYCDGTEVFNNLSRLSTTEVGDSAFWQWVLLAHSARLIGGRLALFVFLEAKSGQTFQMVGNTKSITN